MEERTLEQVLCMADPAAIIRAELVLTLGPVVSELRPIEPVQEYSFKGTPAEIRHQLKTARREYFLEQTYEHIGKASDGDIWRIYVSVPAADPAH